MIADAPATVQMERNPKELGAGLTLQVRPHRIGRREAVFSPASNGTDILLR
jgi:hypothetical protein